MKTTQIVPFQYSDHDALLLKIIQKQKKRRDQVTGNLIYPSLKTKTSKKPLKAFGKPGNNKK